MEERPSYRVGLVNTFRTQSREKRTGKKNGSSDLIDLGIFRLIRRSSKESTWPSIPGLVLQGSWKVLCIFKKQGM